MGIKFLQNIMTGPFEFLCWNGEWEPESVHSYVNCKGWPVICVNASMKRLDQSNQHHERLATWKRFGMLIHYIVDLCNWIPNQRSSLETDIISKAPVRPNCSFIQNCSQLQRSAVWRKTIFWHLNQESSQNIITWASVSFSWYILELAWRILNYFCRW